jgi:hypothetical protein
LEGPLAGSKRLTGEQFEVQAPAPTAPGWDQGFRVFHISSHRDSRNPAATRVIRRNTNRRHMISDPHDRRAGRTPLLVGTVDEIRGTHILVAAKTDSSPAAPAGTAALVTSDV